MKCLNLICMWKGHSAETKWGLESRGDKVLTLGPLLSKICSPRQPESKTNWILFSSCVTFVVVFHSWALWGSSDTSGSLINSLHRVRRLNMWLFFSSSTTVPLHGQPHSLWRIYLSVCFGGWTLSVIQGAYCGWIEFPHNYAMHNNVLM